MAGFKPNRMIPGAECVSLERIRKTGLLVNALTLVVTSTGTPPVTETSANPPPPPGRSAGRRIVKNGEVSPGSETDNSCAYALAAPKQAKRK